MSLLDFFRPKWKHSDPKVRLEAIEKVIDKSILNRISRYDINADVRITAIEKVTDNIVLKEIAMNDKNADVRRAATKKVIDKSILNRISRYDINADVRITAIQKVTNQKVLSAIAMNDENADVRNAAVERTKSADVHKVAVKRTKSADARNAAIKKQKDKSPNVKKLKKEKDIEGLIDALKHEKRESREDAALALGSLGDNRAVEPLIEALKDIESNIRYFAASSLAELGDKKAVEPLIDILLHDEDITVRERAAESLGELKDLRAAEPLFEALHDEDVEGMAVLALVKLDDKKAIELLCRVLQEDFHSQLQLFTAEKLIEIGNEITVEPLIHYLKNKDEDIYEAILKIFDNLSHWAVDWRKGKKEIKFNPVYSFVAGQLGIPNDKEPTEIIYVGNDIDVAIDKLCAIAIPQTPILSESQVRSKYTRIRESWGSELQKGKVDDLLNTLRPRLKNDLADSGFSELDVRTYYTQRCSQVESHFKGKFKGYRIWNSDKELFFCFSPD